MKADNLKKTLEKKVFTVNEFVKVINEAVSCFDSLWVEGEITDFKNWQNIQIYFKLKDLIDKSTVLDCSIPKYKLDRLGVIIEDGMKVRIIGVPRIGKNGRFTLSVQKIQLHGEGTLKKAYELLKRKLELEGLFDRKRKIPDFVQKIGVITSKSGVVIQDFQNNLKPFNFETYFFDARVEGQEAVNSLVKGIKWFNEKMPGIDVLVIIRGGGSLESLQPFNNEVLGRTMFASKIPVICGIGHDVNMPIASLIADVSVSTPLATAVALNRSWELLINQLPYLEEKLFDNFEDYLNRIGNKIEEIRENLLTLFQETLKEKLKLIKEIEKDLFTFSPERNLRLGYSIVLNQDKKVIKDVLNIKLDEIIQIKFYKGEISSKVKKIFKLS